MERLLSTFVLSPLSFWVLGSVLTYAIVTNLGWLTRSYSIWHSPVVRWAVEVGRFLFYLGIPYLVLGGWPQQPFQGLLSPQDLGIVGLDQQWSPTRWLGAVGIALGLGFLALLILSVAWRNANRAHDGTSLRFPPRPWWMVLLDVLYLELHWAFYRSAVAALQEDLYAGVFLGMGLVYLEWALDPFWRKGWRERARASVQWLQAALVIISALTFLLTRNLWACLLTHGLLTFCLLLLGRYPAVAPAAGLPSLGQESPEPLNSVPPSSLETDQRDGGEQPP